MIRLDDLQNATGGQLFGDALTREFHNFAIDINQVKQGSMFAVLTLESGSIDEIAGTAAARGATGILCEHPPSRSLQGLTVLIVGDVVAALGQWVSYILREYGTYLVAIIGDEYQSLAASSVQTVLRRHYPTYYEPVESAGPAGLAVSLGELGKEHQVVIAELRTSYPGELTNLLSMTQPSTIVVSSLKSHAGLSPRQTIHIEQAVQQAAHSLPEFGSLIMASNDVNETLLQGLSPNLVLYAVSDEHNTGVPASLVARSPRYLIDRTQFDLWLDGQTDREQWVSLPGYPGMRCALAALTVALTFNIELGSAMQALREFQPPPGYLARVEGLNGATVLDNTGAASPGGITDGLGFLRQVETRRGRRIAIVGDFVASGESIEIAYWEIGKSASFVDLLIITGADLAVAARALRGAHLPTGRVACIARPQDAVKAVTEYAQSGDLILVCGRPDTRIRRIIEGLTAPGPQGRRPQLQQAVLQHFESTPSTWVEIDLDALVNNISKFKSSAPASTELMVDVSFNAFGHGSLAIAATALRNGARLLAVRSVLEGLDLRYAGFSEPLLVTGMTPTDQFHHAVEHDLTLTIVDVHSARHLARTARTMGRNASVQLRVDVGVGGYSVPADEVASLVREIIRLDGLRMDGIYADFSTSGSTTSQRQFETVLASMRATGLTLPHIHASHAGNSFPGMTVINTGPCLYGLQSREDYDCPRGVKPILAWKCLIVQIRDGVLPDASRGRVAVIAAGYADGLQQQPDVPAEVLIGGHRARMVGPPGPDWSTVDISHLSEVRPRDEVVLIGTQGRESISASQMARRMGMTVEEVLALIAPHIPRIT